MDFLNFDRPSWFINITDQSIKIISLNVILYVNRCRIKTNITVRKCLRTILCCQLNKSTHIRRDILVSEIVIRWCSNDRQHVLLNIELVYMVGIFRNSFFKTSIEVTGLKFYIYKWITKSLCTPICYIIGISLELSIRIEKSERCASCCE